MMIKLEVPFHYACEWVPPRKRNPQRIMCRETTEVSIREASSDDAPLVVRWTSRPPWEELCEIRELDGRFYQPSSDRDEPITRGNFRIEHLRVSQGDYVPYGVTEMDGPPDWDRVLSVEGIRDRAAWTHAIDQAREAVRAAADGAVFIDGALCLRAELPRLRATADYGFGYGRGARLEIDSRGDSPDAHGMVFTLAELDMAKAYAAERARWLANEADEVSETTITQPELLEVLRPDLVPEDGNLAREMTRVGQFLLENALRSEGLPKLADDEILRWIDCRRATREAAETQSSEAVGIMLEEWAKFYEAHEAAERERRLSYGSNYRKEDDIYFHAIASARATWDARPVDLTTDEDTGRAFGM